MPVSDAKKKANARWNASKDNIMIRPTKEEGATIRAAAIAAGQSNQQYILQATRERMSREAAVSCTRPADAGEVYLDHLDPERQEGVLGPDGGRTEGINTASPDKLEGKE